MGGSTNLGVIVTASLAGLLFGFDTVVIFGRSPNRWARFSLDAGSFWYGFSVASALLGTFIGGARGRRPGDRLRFARHAERRCRLHVRRFRRWAARSAGTCECSTCFASSAGWRSAPVGARAGLHLRRLRRRIGAARSPDCSSSTSCSASCWRTSAISFVQEMAGGADLWRLKLGIAAVRRSLFASVDVHHSAEPSLADVNAGARRGEGALQRVGVKDH